VVHKAAPSCKQEICAWRNRCWKKITSIIRYVIVLTEAISDHWHTESVVVWSSAQSGLVADGSPVGVIAGYSRHGIDQLPRTMDRQLGAPAQVRFRQTAENERQHNRPRWNLEMPEKYYVNFNKWAFK
uniref:Monooxygenase n=1 Tax=Ascaris lumbricoides TaxID=6252 RepID=A0A0M3I7E7_ASCLU